MLVIQHCVTLLVLYTVGSLIFIFLKRYECLSQFIFKKRNEASHAKIVLKSENRTCSGNFAHII
jgi:hypothetical protein